MTLRLDLTPELERRLRSEAARRNQAADEVALRLLDQHLPPVDGRSTALSLLKQWAAEDDALTDEECAENAAILRAFDEDRPSYRKLFADILKSDPA